MLSELELAEKAREFEHLERDFLKFTYEANKPTTNESRRDFLTQALGIALQAYQTQQEILELFGQMSEVRVSDSSVQHILEKIRKNEPFYSISFYENIIELFGKNADDNAQTKIGDIIADLIDRNWEPLFDDFNSRYGFYNYFYAKMKIGPIISSFKLPKNLIVYFNEIRETFAFEQYRAAIALCRALLEMCLYEKLNAKRVFARGQYTNVVPIQNAKEDSLFKYIKYAEKYRFLSEVDTNIAHGIRDAANKILHVKQSPAVPQENETLKIIWDTMSILQKLYNK